jgi:hypothetical protein
MTAIQQVELVSQAERRSVLVSVPHLVDARLEMLVRVARSGGVQVSRSQLLAALVAAAPVTTSRVSRLARDYLALEVPDFQAGHPQGALPEVRHPGRKRQ